MSEIGPLPRPAEEPERRFSSMTEPLQHVDHQIMTQNDSAFVQHRLHVPIQREQFVDHLAYTIHLGPIRPSLPPSTSIPNAISLAIVITIIAFFFLGISTPTLDATEFPTAESTYTRRAREIDGPGERRRGRQWHFFL